MRITQLTPSNTAVHLCQTVGNLCRWQIHNSGRRRFQPILLRIPHHAHDFSHAIFIARPRRRGDADMLADRILPLEVRLGELPVHNHHRLGTVRVGDAKSLVRR